MKPATALALVITITIGTMTMTTRGAGAYVWEGPCSGWRYGETVKRDTPVHRRETRMRRLIVCVFNRWAPGHAAKALQVFWRESRWIPWAKNPWVGSACRFDPIRYGSCGIAQHLMRYWDGRRRAYLTGWWFPNSWPRTSPLDPRAGAIAAAKMVRSGGWGPWVTA